MLGLSGLGLLTLITSGTEYGNALRKDGKFIKDGIDKLSASRRSSKYTRTRLDIIETCIKHGELLDKMDELIKSNNPVVNKTAFCDLYIELNKIRGYRMELVDIVLIHKAAKMNEDIVTIAFDKSFIRYFESYKTTIDLSGITLKALLYKNDNGGNKNE